MKKIIVICVLVVLVFLLGFSSIQKDSCKKLADNIEKNTKIIHCFIGCIIYDFILFEDIQDSTGSLRQTCMKVCDRIHNETMVGD